MQPQNKPFLALAGCRRNPKTYLFRASENGTRIMLIERIYTDFLAKIRVSAVAST